MRTTDLRPLLLLTKPPFFQKSGHLFKIGFNAKADASLMGALGMFAGSLEHSS